MPESEPVRKVNNLFVTECISHPRCGHQMLLDVLQHKFGDRIVYCDIYLHPEHAIDSDPRTNYQKNHDFEMSTQVKQDRRYLVQVRDPMEAWPSWWEMNHRALTAGDGFSKCCSWFVDYYTAFVKKWILSDIPNRLIVRYEDLIDHPMDTVANVVQFITGVPANNIPRLREALELYPIKARRRKSFPNIHFA